MLLSSGRRLCLGAWKWTFWTKKTGNFEILFRVLFNGSYLMEELDKKIL